MLARAESPTDKAIPLLKVLPIIIVGPSRKNEPNGFLLRVSERHHELHGKGSPPCAYPFSNDAEITLGSVDRKPISANLRIRAQWFFDPVILSQSFDDFSHVPEETRQPLQESETVHLPNRRTLRAILRRVVWV